MKKLSISKVQRSSATIVTIALLFSALVRADSLRTNPHRPYVSLKGKLGDDHVDGDSGKRFSKENATEEIGTELYPTGSTLPDCSHACGACVPCKRVMVSYKCATESCPVVYRCMCKGKYYHVPSN